MTHESKRILITLRCSRCGLDLEGVDLAYVMPLTGEVLCLNCDLAEADVYYAGLDAEQELEPQTPSPLG